MLSKINHNNKSNTKLSSSANKSINNSNSKNYHLQNTRITRSQIRQNITLLTQKDQNSLLSHKKSKYNIYSKSKSQASFSKSQKRSTNGKNVVNQNENINRLLKSTKCLKHQPWFNCVDQYPFKPDIKSQLFGQINSDKMINRSKQEKFQRLIQDMRNKQLKRFECKMMIQKQQIQTRCSFIPNRQRLQQQKMSLTDNNNSSKCIHDRLFEQYKWIQQKNKNNELIRLSKQDEQIDRYRRQNKQRYNKSKQKWQRYLNTQINKNNYQKPIYQRVKQINYHKKQFIQQLQFKYQHNYHYNINNNKNSLNNNNNKQNKKVNKLSIQKQKQLIKRLCDDYKVNKIKHQQQLKQIISKQIKSKYTFTPISNQNDLYRINTNNINNTNNSKQKQNINIIIKNNNNTLLQKQIYSYTFIPHINQMSKIIVSKIQSINNKSNNHNNNFYFNKCQDNNNDEKNIRIQQFGQRLSSVNKQQKIIKLNKIQSQIYNQCTFKPQINLISKELRYLQSNSNNLQNYNHYHNQFNNQYHNQFNNQFNNLSLFTTPHHLSHNNITHKCPIPQSIIKQQQQLTFKPIINQKSQFMTDNQKSLVLIKSKQKYKQKLQSIENHQQYQQMKQCTFQPKTISTNQQWSKWKQIHLKKQKLFIHHNHNHHHNNQLNNFNHSKNNNHNQFKNNQSNNHNNQINNNNSNNNNQLTYSDRQNPQTYQNKTTIVKGIDKFIKNCQNIKRKKQSHLQRYNQIFNFQQKYNQRIKKQKYIKPK